ncbi:MAG: FIG00453955: hypothetical protein [uncultured Paraburkholderia sp.]|uniref:hypothetical protein n=1 Tax=uncultured Paraburkholderia sp. TaxID=1822466 RepID=UPI0025944503|nr:hypothetical protein [uncultured Paraburkholderia sp.]CAH2897091.1 MAG: FIG00453955: hypothetical protein [uncultured Paraburkholderia sp.]CAH2920942.1 MAG: FIG00453955: hypothetical protein [uncultured Paraburkholderia sp.]
MRTISAALLGAGAALSSLAHATTAVPDPTDAAASVPVVIVQSAFDGYKSWQDGDAPSWQQLNRAVAPTRSTAKIKHGQQTSATAGEKAGHGHGGESK